MTDTGISTATNASLDGVHPLEDRYRLILEAMNQGFCVLEMIFDDENMPIDYRFLETNVVFERHTGLADAVGKTARELVPGLEPIWFETYGRVATTGESIQFVDSAAAMSGRSFDVNAFRIGGEGSRTVGLLFTDITERMSSDQMWLDYVAMVSHDLGTPMTIAKGQAQLMLRRGTFSAERLKTIIDQIGRMERLLANLRTAVRAKNGWVSLHVLQEDLDQVVAESVQRGRLQSPDREWTLTSDGPVPGYWDRERLEQILDNLIGNAIKYSPPAAPIVVRLTANGTMARFSVTDAGAGIAPETLPHLFQRFYRVNPGGATPGMGLGLYITQTLVTAKGGRVWAESDVGVGSTFIVELPIRHEPEVASATSPVSPATGTAVA